MGTIVGAGSLQAGKVDQPDLLFRFIPNETFKATVNGKPNIYVKGMKYSVMKANTELQELVPSWIITGKVERID
jgi:hypothetical protein